MTTGAGSFRSRRAVLGAALGGAAAVAATSVRPLGVRAADTENAILGAANTSNTPTSFENLDAAEASIVGMHAADGIGVKGSSGSATGMRGISGDETNATASWANTGVYGYCDSSAGAAGVWGDSFQGIGVYGTGDFGIYGYLGAAAVVGENEGTGIGVMGFTGTFSTWPATLPTGVGVFAVAGSTSQVALKVNGKAQFSRSARKSIGSTKSSLKVTMAGVTTASYIIATLQTSVSGVYVRAVVPASGSFTIYLSKAPRKTVYVGYMVIN